MSDKQICNNILAAMLWHDVKPSQVVKKLHIWKCNGHACFGGWVGKWPEFKEQGVLVDELDGSPYMMNEFRRNVAAMEVSFILFGNHHLFDQRGDCPFDVGYHRLSDHKLVAKRLEANFVELTSAD